MRDVADVVVIGGGCTGTSIAWQLARRRAGRVVLVERQGLAAGATGRSGAIVRTHYTHEVLARLALHARRVFERFDEVVGGDARFRRTGFLALVGPRDAAALAANVAMHRRVGIDARLLTPEEVRELEPRLARDGVGAGAWEPDSGYADAQAATAGFAAAARRHGAELRLGPAVAGLVVGPGGVERVETSAGPIHTRVVVVAAGYRSRDLLAPHGVDLPLTPLRQTVAVLRRSPGFGGPHPVISDRVGGAYYRPAEDELTRVGASTPYEGREDPEVELDRAPDPADVAALAARFGRRFPSQATAAPCGGYTCTYDCSPDLQPLLGPVPGVAGLHVAAGFSGHGFKLSPVVGELLAARIVEGRTALADLDLFSPARFAERRPITAPHPYSVATLG